MILFSRPSISWRCVAPLRFVRFGLRFASQWPEYLEITMPALSPTMTKGGLASWSKKVGDRISPGDRIAEIETDKATVDFEAQEEGYLAKQLVEQGTTDIPVGNVLGIMVEDESDVSKFEHFSLGDVGTDQAQGTGPSAESFPDHQLLTMPALSPTMTQGQVAKWRKKKGDAVKVGDCLAEIETDKATVDFESLDDGYVAKILVEANEPGIQVGRPIAVLVEDESAVEAFRDYEPISEQPAPKAATPAKESAAATTPKPSPPPKQPSRTKQPSPAPSKPASGARVFASPYARKIAAENNVDIRQITPTGPNNRIVARDVEAFLETGAVAGIAVGNAEAEAAATSKQTIPHYYLTVKINADAILKLVASQPNDHPISLRDFIVKASAAVMKDVPIVNSRWNGDSIRQFQYVDVGVQAVNDEGRFFTYVVPDADRRGLREIAASRSNEAPVSDATFTISSVQGPGVSQVSAIIVPSQAAILALGQVESTIVPGRDATWKQANVFQATLSCDHRIVDGAVGAQWLQALKRYCEDPFSLLL